MPVNFPTNNTLLTQQLPYFFNRLPTSLPRKVQQFMDTVGMVAETIPTSAKDWQVSYGFPQVTDVTAIPETNVETDARTYAEMVQTLKLGSYGVLKKFDCSPTTGIAVSSGYRRYFPNGGSMADVLSNAEFVADFAKSYQDGHMSDIIDSVWFNDESAATIANSGVFTNSTTAKKILLMRQNDGLFKKIFIAQTATAPLEKLAGYTAITTNTATTYAGQQAFTGADVFATLTSVADKADFLSWLNEEFVIQMTPRSFAALRRYAEANQNATQQLIQLGSFIVNATTGVTSTTMTFRGIPIIQKMDWNQFIDTFQNNGTKWFLPERIVLTSVPNIICLVNDDLAANTMVVKPFAGDEAMLRAVRTVAQGFRSMNFVSAAY